MKGAGWLVASAALAVLVAGCSGTESSAAPKATNDVPSSAPPVAAGDDTGVIEGHVFSAEQLPLAEAEVTAYPGGQRTVSAADGTYRLGPLPPGAYTVRVSRLGYLNAETQARVEAGQAARVDFTLQDLPTVLEPRKIVFGPMAGFMECQMSLNFNGVSLPPPLPPEIGGSSNGPCGTFPMLGETPITDLWTNDQNDPMDFPLDAEDWRHIVVEARWQDSSAATRPLLVQYLSYAERVCNHWFNRSVPAESPLLVGFDLGQNGTRKNIPEADDGAGCEGQPFQPNAPMTLRTWLKIPDAIWSQPVDLAYQTRYELIATVFYSMDVPSEYTAFA
jgi:hypothetical protein